LNEVKDGKNRIDRALKDIRESDIFILAANSAAGKDCL
jgi:hypothetical protein